MAIGPKIQVAVGVVDGVNVDFKTGLDYITGSVQVFIGGQLKRVDFEDGWTEQGGKDVKLTEAPEAGDVVQIYYRPL